MYFFVKIVQNLSNRFVLAAKEKENPGALKMMVY